MSQEDERTMLTTLNEGQAAIIQRAFARVAAAERSRQEAQRELDEKLALLAPKGANGFDPETMTFFSAPQPKPETEDIE